MILRLLCNAAVLAVIGVLVKATIIVKMIQWELSANDVTLIASLRQDIRNYRWASWWRCLINLLDLCLLTCPTLVILNECLEHESDVLRVQVICEGLFKLGRLLRVLLQHSLQLR